MSDLLTISRPYARAAFEFAKANGHIADWQKQLAVLAQIVERTEVKQWLNNPMNTDKQRVETLVQLGDISASEGMKNLLSQLAGYKRLTLIPEIEQLFTDLVNNDQSLVDVLVSSAFALTDEQLAKITASMKAKLGREVELATEVDESLIGGIKVQAGDLVIDNTIKGRLDKMADSFGLDAQINT